MEPLAPDRSGGPRLSIPSRTDAQKAGPAPRSGTGFSFFAKALKDLGGGKWLFAEDRGGAGALRFTASVPFPIRAGDVVRAVRSDGTAGAPAVRILSPLLDARADFIRSLGVVPDSVSLFLVAVARAIGARVDGPRLVKLRSVVREAVSSGGIDEESASAAALSADEKGVATSADAVRAVSFGAQPESFSDNGKRRRDPRFGAPDAESVRSSVSEFQGTDDPLAFLNAVVPESGRTWLVFPLDFRRGSIEIAASLSLLLNLNVSDHSRRVEHFALGVRAPSRYWSFAAKISAGILNVRADPPLGAADGSLGAVFAEAFAPLGWSVLLSQDRADRRLFDSLALEPPAVSEDA